MFALSMLEEYILDILNGYRTCDVRLHTSSKIGKIGLIKSKTNLLYGYVEFVSIEQITYEEYVYWHVGKNYSFADSEEYIHKSCMKNKMNRAYKYNFINPVLLDVPIKVSIKNKNGSWIEYDERLNKIGYKKIELFNNT